jgi:predicted Rossmann fold nucleotide-binding protein DprA/Smf involved in DNA uptake
MISLRLVGYSDTLRERHATIVGSRLPTHASCHWITVGPS